MQYRAVSLPLSFLGVLHPLGTFARHPLFSDSSIMHFFGTQIALGGCLLVFFTHVAAAEGDRTAAAAAV